jgi:polyphosphate kinase 2 (PPK2 family)
VIAGRGNRLVGGADQQESRSGSDSLRISCDNGHYPYPSKIRTTEFMALKAELLKVQNWVKMSGQRIVGIFEGRDAAGKDGRIRSFREHFNPEPPMSLHDILPMHPGQ